IAANPDDGDLTAYYQITNITGGTLYQNDGTTQINNGDFITVAQGSAGLKFTPDADQNDNIAAAYLTYFGFDIQGSETNDASGLGGTVVTVKVSVAPVNDAPTFDLAGDVTVDEDSAAYGPTSFATNFVPGPVTALDESGQSLDFTVDNNNTALFSAQPDIND